MKTFSLLILLVVPTASVACEPTSGQMEDYWIRSRQKQETYLINLAKEADQIFTGAVVEVSDLEDGPYAQLAHIKTERILKGHPGGSANAKMWARDNPERDHPTLDNIASCDEPPDPAQINPYALETYRYLFYVKDGVLLRANGFPLGPSPLEPQEEMDLLQEQALGGRQ